MEGKHTGLLTLPFLPAYQPQGNGLQVTPHRRT